MGYWRAGFEVVGMDISTQLDYPFEFERDDALAYLMMPGRLPYDAIHASPPCQASCALTKGTNKAKRAHLHTDLIADTRTLLNATGLPYVIENVQGSKLRRDLTLCGEMFGLGVIRHRYFELGGWTMPKPKHKPHRGRVQGWRHGKYYEGPYFAVYGDGGGKGTLSDWQQAMGIDWVHNKDTLAEMIPPAYTEFIGRQLFEHVMRVAA